MIWHGGKRPSFDGFSDAVQNNMVGHLGIEMEDVGDDFLRMKMPVDVRTHQPAGRLHGGASVALAETVGSFAAGNCVDLTRFLVVGAEINANHLRPAFSGWVHATARPVSLGRALHVWSVDIVDDAGKQVCVSRFTAAVIPLERGGVRNNA